MRLNECDVWISCDGEALPEYNTQVEGYDKIKISCWIPSEVGKNFKIYWYVTHPGECFRFEVRLDGMQVDTYLDEPGIRGRAAYIHLSETTKRAFCFAPLVTTDDDDAMADFGSEYTGTIQVTVNRARKIYLPRATVFPNHKSQYHDMAPVHERSKKAGSHRVGLGQEVATSSTVLRSWRTAPMIPEEGPIAIFMFRYRPLDWLQAQGIAPPPKYIRDRSYASSAATSTPGQSSAQRPMSLKRRRSGSQSSEAEVKQELIEPEPGERLAALQTQMKQIQDEINRMQEITKRSRTDVSAGTGRIIPRRNERWASSAPASRQRDGVFDLTSDE